MRQMGGARRRRVALQRYRSEAVSWQELTVQLGHYRFEVYTP